MRRVDCPTCCIDGYESVLRNSRDCFLKRKSNLTIRQVTKLRDLLKYDLNSMQAFALKESFDAFRKYESLRWAGWFLKKCCARAIRSKLTPMKKFIGTLRNHEDLLMNYFKAAKLYFSSETPATTVIIKATRVWAGGMALGLVIPPKGLT